MRRSRTNDRSAVTRRQALAGAAATVGLGLAGAPASQSIAAALTGAKVCILTPQAVEGPFYFDPKLVRADITEGKPGVPLKLTLQVVEATKDCARLEGARVDVWHSDDDGRTQL